MADSDIPGTLIAAQREYDTANDAVVKASQPQDPPEGMSTEELERWRAAESEKLEQLRAVRLQKTLALYRARDTHGFQDYPSQRRIQKAARETPVA